MAPPRRPEIVIGLDVGKSSHWACVATRDGEVLASEPIPNREDAIDGLYAQYPGALVVVDQVRNIGSLALSRAKLAGMPRAYLPGLAAQRDFLTCENTRSKNRLRSILLESCPEFEAQADLSDPATLKLMAAVGGPWSISEASSQAVGALTRGCRRAKMAALVEPPNRQAGRTRRPSPARTAPRNRRSGTSMSSASASRQGNKRLKNLFIFSCSCLARSRNR